MSGENVPTACEASYRQSDRHVSRENLFLPGISYHVPLMSVQVAETNPKPPSPFLNFTSAQTLHFEACVDIIIGHQGGWLLK